MIASAKLEPNTMSAYGSTQHSLAVGGDLTRNSQKSDSFLKRPMTAYMKASQSIRQSTRGTDFNALSSGPNINLRSASTKHHNNASQRSTLDTLNKVRLSKRIITQKDLIEEKEAEQSIRDIEKFTQNLSNSVNRYPKLSLEHHMKMDNVMQ